jgi:hypothetical protein
VQSACDHQVQHQPERLAWGRLTLKAYGNTLADAAQAGNPAAFSERDGRRGCSEQRRSGDLYSLKHMPEDALLQCFDVDDDIRQLRH